jgi:hypothetical protein
MWENFMEAVKEWTLENICGHYRLVLVDTSALISSLKVTRKKSYFKRERITDLKSYHESQRDFAKSFIDFINLGFPIYITSSIAKEYSQSQKGDYKKKIRENNRDTKRFVLNGLGKQIPMLYRVNRDSNKLRRKLNELFSEKGRILDFREEGPYLEQLDKYNHGISEIGSSDLDFLITGLTISNHYPVALVSNDSGIKSFWRYISRREGKVFSQYGFFLRQDPNSFFTPNMNY